MENAAQALLIAGGILLAILTVTTLVYMFNNAAILGNADEQKAELERITAWNAEWEAYNKRYLYGAEVLTVLNKVEQNNIDNRQYLIEIHIKTDGNVTVLDTHDYVGNRKTNLFTCTEMSYSEEGRINKIVFQFVE